MQEIAAHQILIILIDANLSILVHNISDIYSRVMCTLSTVASNESGILKQWNMDPLVKRMIEFHESHQEHTTKMSIIKIHIS